MITLRGCGSPNVGPVAPAGASFATVAHPTLCRSDAANTVPCGDGDAIRWWRDLVTGTWYEQATSGSRWILRADGSRWYAENDGTRFHTFGPSGISGSAASTLAVGGRNTSGFGEWLGFGAATFARARSVLVGFPSAGDLAFDTGGGLYCHAAGTTGSDGRWVISIGAGLLLSQSTIRRNGVVLSGTLVGSDVVLNTTAGNVELGRWVGGGVNPVGRLYASAVFASVADAVADSWLARYTP